MKKIPSLFKRNYETDRLVKNEVVEGSEWVFKGEGIATQKYDGTACMVKNNKLHKRYDVKKGRVPPSGAIPCQEPDPITGHHPHWVEVGWETEDKWYRDALISKNPYDVGLLDGTYELCGEKINGNSEQIKGHMLILHGITVLPEIERNFESIKTFLSDGKIEGIVYHHPDGRMVKIKGKDFGFKRNSL